MSIFLLPVVREYLLYAPLHGVSALINRAAARSLRAALFEGGTAPPAPLAGLWEALSAPGEPPPGPKAGALDPAFLGLLPTRACNLGCRYCGFLDGAEGGAHMDLTLARDTIRWYVETARAAGRREIDVHFFGGEPFCASEVLDLVVPLARRLAEPAGCRVRFEAVTNGVYGEERRRWAADNLDAIVLSFDGPADVQNRNRPFRDGAGSYDAVARSAEILAGGRAELSFRCCVTSQTTARMPEIAAWFAGRFQPHAVCFEPVRPGSAPTSSEWESPDPWEFSAGFIRAARVLEELGIEAVCSAAEVSTRRASFCPVGQDVPIVSPDGTISACYLLRRDWEARGMDLRFGRMENGTARLDDGALEAVRALNVWNKPLCRKCFCRWHCAGGCHVQHRPGAAYSDHCIEIRTIAMRNILKQLDRDSLMDELLRDRGRWEAAVLEPSDLLREAA